MVFLTQGEQRVEFATRWFDTERRHRGNFNMRTTVDYADALREVNRRFEGLVANLPQRVSLRLAGRLKAGESDWPVRTGYSQSRFTGDERGILNDASYAPGLETEGAPDNPAGTESKRLFKGQSRKPWSGYGAAHRFVDANIKLEAERIAEELIDGG